MINLNDVKVGEYYRQYGIINDNRFYYSIIKILKIKEWLCFNKSVEYNVLATYKTTNLALVDYDYHSYDFRQTLYWEQIKGDEKYCLNYIDKCIKANKIL